MDLWLGQEGSSTKKVFCLVSRAPVGVWSDGIVTWSDGVCTGKVCSLVSRVPVGIRSDCPVAW